MKTTDIRFGSSELAALSGMVGKTMDMYISDPFPSPTAAFGIVGFAAGGCLYRLTNTVRPMDWFGSSEDVAVMALSRADPQGIRSMIAGDQMAEINVGRRITGIDVVNEEQKLFRNGVQTYDVFLTRGIVFYFDDGTELSFEKSVWFSENINIGRGKALAECFTPEEEFTDDWEGEYRAGCARTLIHLSAER